MLDKQADPNRSKDRIHPQAVARTVSDLAKKELAAQIGAKIIASYAIHRY